MRATTYEVLNRPRWNLFVEPVEVTNTVTYIDL